jgi:hypothetical protein
MTLATQSDSEQWRIDHVQDFADNILEICGLGESRKKTLLEILVIRHGQRNDGAFSGLLICLIESVDAQDWMHLQLKYAHLEPTLCYREMI